MFVHVGSKLIGQFRILLTSSIQLYSTASCSQHPKTRMGRRYWGIHMNKPSPVCGFTSESSSKIKEFKKWRGSLQERGVDGVDYAKEKHIVFSLSET